MPSEVFIYYPRAMAGNGGVTVAAWAWARALKRSGVAICVGYDSALDQSQPLAVDDVKCVPIRHIGVGRLRVPIGLAPLLSPSTVLVVHSAFSLGNLVSAICAHSVAAGVVFVPHGAYARVSMRSRRHALKRCWLAVERFWLSRAMFVHVFSNQEVADIRRVSPKANVLVAPTPVGALDVEPWCGGGGYIAWFGRYDMHIKGLDILLDAYAGLDPSKRLPLRLHGRDSKNTAEEVREVVRAKGLAGSVTVLGPVEGSEKFEFLRRCEYFVMPSRSESFSMAMLEALALDVPIMVSRGVPIAAWCEKEEAAVAFSPDPAALRSLMQTFSEQGSSSRRRFQGKRFAEEHFSEMAAGGKFVAEIERCLSSRGGRGSVATHEE